MVAWQVAPEKRCSLCEGRDLFVFAERAGVPVYQNVPGDTADAARSVPRGDLRLACCRSCGFIANVAFDPRLLSYQADYENDQTYSSVFEAHTQGLVDALLGAGCRDAFVLEIGAGQGQFLRALAQQGNNRGQGYDPAYRGPDSVDGGRITFVRDVYRGQRPTEPARFVVCRHVLEHVPEPMSLLDQVRTGVAGEGVFRVAFEMRAVDWILERTMVQDFFYEHCSYFTEASLRFAFERAGFAHVTTSRTFGGQYLWATADHVPRAPAGEPRRAPEALLGAVERYQRHEPTHRAALKTALQRLRAAGPVAIWGAGAKGVTYLNMVDPAAEVVDCTVDVNPRKQGKFIAGTGHPIVSPEAMVARGVRGVLVMNPIYLEEVRRTVRALDPDVVVA
jgi:methyltransferase family protein/C-methyltransferase-like protein